MKLKHLLPALLALLLAAPSALAQVTDSAAVEAESLEEADVDAVPDPEANGAADADARAAYAETIEAAREAAREESAEGHLRAAEHYLGAAELAAASEDAELQASASGALTGALKAYADAGGAYSNDGDYARAAAAFDQAAAIAERLSDEDAQAQTLYSAAVALAAAEQLAEAIERLEVAIELAPENLSYLHAQGTLLGQAGDAEAAAEAYRQLIERAEEAGDETMAARARESAGKLYLVRAQGAIQAEHYAQAIDALDEAATYLGENNETLNSLYASAYYRQGVGQVQAENLAAAKTSLRRAQEYARKAGRDQIVTGAQQQLDYIEQVQSQ